MKYLVYLSGINVGLALLFASIYVSEAAACTRVMYAGENEIVLTARSMDWKENPQSDMWIFPRGMERGGAVGQTPMKWRSKYGSVVLSAYDMCTTDGMNEKGLNVNLLWLSESVYPKWNGKKPAISVSVWAQYLLDNCATVAEAVDAMSSGEFVVLSDMMPDGSRPATLHISVSDASGDNAVFEYIAGKLQIHHGKTYKVMTNSPPYDSQLALDDYWTKIGGLVFLPGTNRAADRFARASFYVDALPQTSDIQLATAGILSVIRNVSVPLGIAIPDEPNISSTRWRIVAEQKNLRYYYESTLQPDIFWVDFSDVDFAEGAPVRKFELNDGKSHTGNVAALFKPSRPFDFMGIVSR